jgi:DNA-binding transcriptional LysR family regulator
MNAQHYITKFDVLRCRGKGSLMKARMRGIDLDLLRVFQAVAIHRGFSAAQDALGSTQSAISMNMSRLESRLGVRLCERGAKGFRLTAHGEQVLKAVERLFVAVDEFRSDTERVKGRIAGTLRVGIVDNVSFNPDYRLPVALLSLNQKFPDLSVSIFVGAPLELEERLLDGRIRVAVGLFHRQVPALTYQPLFSEEHQLFCGAAHPFYALPDESVTDAVLKDAHYVGRDYLEDFKPLKPPLAFRSVASSGYMEGLANLILSGAYIAYLPTHYGGVWASQGKMRAIRPSDFARRATIYTVYRRSRTVAPELRAFLDIVQRLGPPKSVRQHHQP